jgi:hypothetical protein
MTSQPGSAHFVSGRSRKALGTLPNIPEAPYRPDSNDIDLATFLSITPPCFYIISRIMVSTPETVANA